MLTLLYRHSVCMLRLRRALTHDVTDSDDENCSALQAYLSTDGAQDCELCALLSVLQISTLLVVHYLLLVVQQVTHIFWGFPRSECACLPAEVAALPQDITARRDVLLPQLLLCLPCTRCSQELPKVPPHAHFYKSVHHLPLGEGVRERGGSPCTASVRARPWSVSWYVVSCIKQRALM